MTPFKAVYGRDAASTHDYSPGSNKIASIDSSLVEHQRLLSSLKKSIDEAKARMVKQANKHRLEKEFNVNDMVYLKLQRYRQQSVQYRQNQKLFRRFFGPYKIIERIGNVAYKLLLPLGSRVHPVFHVSLLKQSCGNVNEQNGNIHEFDMEDNQLIPEAVQDVRLGQMGQKQVLIKWLKVPMEEATWEDLDLIEAKFPHFNIESNVHFEERADDTGQPVNACSEDDPVKRPKRQVAIPKRLLD
ncbi:uncharacterized protein LOC143572330 [Bidens hawaiensis]|uniref:uncharacterized protein LOC143572330 n=1 Tax=Bidens hawaiensis TaxID=980011 RepID=UPI00404A53B4